jgi:DNA-binding response OmpR family regulator
MAASVLVIEDDPTLARTIERNLDALGYDVQSATTVEEAIKLLRHEQPAMLLLDIALPDGCGWDVLRELNPAVREAFPVVAMSVLSLDAQIVRRQGAVAVLQKPFSIETLLRLVTQFLQPPEASAADLGPDG